MPVLGFRGSVSVADEESERASERDRVLGGW
jgi:hypothetical protein